MIAVRQSLIAALSEAGFCVYASDHLGLRARHSASDSEIWAIASYDAAWWEEPVQCWTVMLTVRGTCAVAMTAGTLGELVGALTATINANSARRIAA